MPIDFSCGCGKQYRVADAMAGRRVQCRACGRQLVVPAGEAAGLPDDDSLSAAAEMERQAAAGPEPVRVSVPPPLPLASDEWVKPAPSVPRQTRYVPQKQQKARFSGLGSPIKVRLAQGFVLLSIVGAGFKVYNKLAGGPKDAPGAVQTAIAPASVSRPSMASIEGGVQRGTFSVEGDSGRQAVWVYLPAGAPTQAKSLPCVMVAASGGTALSGVELGDGDVAEHIPYVKAGFAVIAYDVEGDAEKLQDFARAIRAFIRSDAGLRDAERARVNALKLFPELDAERIYAAGHSSSATLALLVAARNPAVKGVVAYAPAADAFLGVEDASIREIEGVFPDIRRFADAHAPANCRPAVPVLLVHSRQDEVLPYESSYRYASAYSDQVTLVTLEQGGHYDSMIGEGMARGVAWLGARAGLSESAPAAKAPAKDPVSAAAAPRGPERPAVVAAQPAQSSTGDAASRSWQAGDYVEVVDGGVWRKARVLQTRGNEYRIHYEGWSDSWDAWVKPDRIRPLSERGPLGSR